MIPQQRFAALLEQARDYQQLRCLYHNAQTNSRTFSLYTDHVCDKDEFPRVTTIILDGHTDEVWNLEWSHSGNFLATASRDKSAIIWRIDVIHLCFPSYRQLITSLQCDADPSTRACGALYTLQDHEWPVGCVAWSLDDSILLTAGENIIKMWNTRVCCRLAVLGVPCTYLVFRPVASSVHLQPTPMWLPH